jgi:hypothetical protein
LTKPPLGHHIHPGAALGHQESRFIFDQTFILKFDGEASRILLSVMTVIINI